MLDQHDTPLRYIELKLFIDNLHKLMQKLVDCRWMEFPLTGSQERSFHSNDIFRSIPWLLRGSRAFHELYELVQGEHFGFVTLDGQIQGRHGHERVMFFGSEIRTASIQIVHPCSDHMRHQSKGVPHREHPRYHDGSPRIMVLWKVITSSSRFARRTPVQSLLRFQYLQDISKTFQFVLFVLPKTPLTAVVFTISVQRHRMMLEWLSLFHHGGSQVYRLLMLWRHGQGD
mmetsp:Transcript_6833/g.12498  ORF Transcript_6833/g.12498 Transcript_6833/m.12498 type:complete len:229 (+) Transcript_6833:1390-2076(+)